MNARDLSSHIACRHAGAGRLVAAGTGDATKVTGKTIDRMTPGSAGYLSAVVAITGQAVLTDAKTISMAIELQESADDSSWDTAEVVQAATVLATSSGGTTEKFCAEHAINLAGRKRYIRFNVTPDLSHSGTDTAEWGATCVLGGSDASPV